MIGEAPSTKVFETAPFELDRTNTRARIRFSSMTMTMTMDQWSPSV